MEIYSQREFNLSFFDQFNKWRLVKISAIIMIFSYCMYVIILGHHYVVADPDDTLSYYLLPGIFLSAIVYSKPCAGLAGSGSDAEEEASFVIGCFGMLYFTISIIIDALY